MATPGELVKVVAAATGTPPATVFQHDRNLVVASLRTKGGRGTSAAKVTARDAAHLFTAILGSEQVKDSAETVLRYADTVEHGSRIFNEHPQAFPRGRTETYAPLKAPDFNALNEEHSFIDALTALITLAIDETFDLVIGREPASCRVHVAWPRTRARIDIMPGDKPIIVRADYGRFTGYAGGRPARAPQERHGGPIERSASMYSVPIRYAGALLGNRLNELPPLTEARADRPRRLRAHC